MYGAIIGDFSGSIYEYAECVDSRNKSINIKRRMDVYNKKILNEDSFFSDDTILTVAIMDCVLNNKDYEATLKEYTIKYNDLKVDYKPYFKGVFSPRFYKWAINNEIGNSYGNGCLMRIAPVAYLYDDLSKVLIEAKKATICSHNNFEAIKATQALVHAIFLLKKFKVKEDIISYIVKLYNYDINLNLDNLQKNNHFIMDAKTTIIQALYILKISSTYEEAILNTLSLGGDTDTVACVVGSLSEAVFKIDKSYIDFVDEKMPVEFTKILKKGYNIKENKDLKVID